MQVKVLCGANHHHELLTFGGYNFGNDLLLFKKKKQHLTDAAPLCPYIVFTYTLAVSGEYTEAGVHYTRVVRHCTSDNKEVTAGEEEERIAQLRKPHTYADAVRQALSCRCRLLVRLQQLHRLIPRLFALDFFRICRQIASQATCRARRAGGDRI
jgi:hypothetical protein